MTRTDNRKHPRVASGRRCWFEGENITFYARVANVSEGGLFLRTRTPLPQGTRALVRLQGEGAEEVSVGATVVWYREMPESGRPAGMGLRFDEVEAGARSQLRRIISEDGRMKATHVSVV